MKPFKHNLSKQRGGVLIGAIVFVAITAIIIAGASQLVASHFKRVQVDADFAAALYLAEAGVNFECRKISMDTTTADQIGNTNGVTYNCGEGTFTVYCTNADGSTPWISANSLYIVSRGLVRGVYRRVKVMIKGFPWPGKFAVYAIEKTSFWNGSAIGITGDVGTNGILDFSGHPAITGSVYFEGPAAGWYGGATGSNGYTVVAGTRPIPWLTVDQIALNKYPAATYPPGGLPYIATHNDNAKAIPPIINNSITNGVTLVAGNYYVTTINLGGQNDITFNNTLGQINLWCGPSGAATQFQFHGGSATQPAFAGPQNACYVYVATQGGISLNGNKELDAAIYAYNKLGDGTPIGYVSNSGNPLIKGVIVADHIDLNGNVQVSVIDGLVNPGVPGYYGFDSSWAEIR